MLKGFLAGLLASIIGLIVYLYVHLGISLDVELAEETRAPIFILFQLHTGPYDKIVHVLFEAEKAAAQLKIDCSKTFGQFLDDPNAVEHDRLRSRAGCVTTELITQPPEGWKADTIPPQKYLVARFKGSPAIGPWKVYPKAQKYMEEKRMADAGPTMEIYSLDGDSLTTEYLFPIH